MDFLFLLLGLAVLIIGGEFLVKGAVGFSNKMKISPLVIGMTVVAFGTSAPELIVSIQSALNGNSGIAIGNVVGSNIVNITLVLGVTVLIFPIIADRQSKRIDLPMMLFSTILFYYFAIDGLISFSDGIILFVILVVFVVLLVTNSRKKTKKQEAVDIAAAQIPFWKSSAFLGLGLIGLFFGAGWFVDGAVGIADLVLAGNPDRDIIIGVTVVAFGTSAPELVASCVAAYRKQTDISLGNLIGSNIFNIFAVIGLSAFVKPIEVSEKALEFDMIWMIGVAVLLAFALLIGNKIGRLKGAILVITYIVYIVLILLKVKGVI
jgi:cation:H+ antiporter